MHTEKFNHDMWLLLVGRKALTLCCHGDKNIINPKLFTTIECTFSIRESIVCLGLSWIHLLANLYNFP